MAAQAQPQRARSARKKTQTLVPAVLHIETHSSASPADNPHTEQGYNDRRAPSSPCRSDCAKPCFVRSGIGIVAPMSWCTPRQQARRNTRQEAASCGGAAVRVSTIVSPAGRLRAVNASRSAGISCREQFTGQAGR
jgi:hypothetical protein